jgi:imidazole glycerol-phosphate synthase subunit HisF
MLNNRVIPILLIEKGGLVKTVKFKNPKYVGDPINAIKIFNEKEVDELIVLDISASKSGINPDYKAIENFASECFMPLCYGGGINNLEQAKTIFSLGVEKIAIQTSIIDNNNFIKSLADTFGNSSIVVSIDIMKNWRGAYNIYSFYRNRKLKRDWYIFLKEIVESGAGEILINSVDRDGTLLGIDQALISETSQAVNIPIIYCGGVGSLEDIKLAINKGASAVGAGSFFVFTGPHRAVLITYPKYSELESLIN